MRIRAATIRSFLFFAALLTASSACAVTPISDCKQNKLFGGVECVRPDIKPYGYQVCDEHGAFNQYVIAWCQAAGGTWNNATGCVGARIRPNAEADIVPDSQDFMRQLVNTVCSGPSSPALLWLAQGQSVNSGLCWSGGPTYSAQGYETGNLTDRFTIQIGSLDGQGQCQTSASNFIASRHRTVACPKDYEWTTGTGEQLCAPRITARQSFCGVGNPCSPVTGAKRQVEVDYVGAGNFPLRLERTYNSLVWTLPGRKFWRHTYDRFVESDTSGTVPLAIVHRQDGTSYFFTGQGGAFVTNGDVNHRLEKVLDPSGQMTGWQLHVPNDDSVETYDVQGHLVEIARRDGLRQTLEYSTAETSYTIAPVPGLLVKVSDPYGRSLQFRYDVWQRLVKVIDPAGHEIAYTYNDSPTTTDWLITSATYPGSGTKTYVYGDSGYSDPSLLSGIIDENGTRIGTYTYDSSGHVTTTQGPGGANRYDVAAPAGWTSTQRTVTDPRGMARTYNYQIVDGVYRYTSIQSSGLPCPACGPKSSSYDSQGNLVQKTDWNDNRTNYGYDLARNLEVSRTEGLTSAGAATAATRTIETQWHATFRLPTQITEKDAAGAVLRTTAMSYDTNGSLLSRTITAGASSRTWSYTYDSSGRVTSIDGPRTDVSDVTTYTYYADDDPDTGRRGNLATITNAAGHVIRITAYDAHGQPVSIDDPNGLTTTLAYDARLRLASRSVGGETTGYSYDGAGQLTRVTLPDGSFLSYAYDAAHRLTGMTDGLGNRIAYTLDVMGNRTREDVYDTANALAQTRSRVYDSLNRLVQEIGAQSQTTAYAYDNQGNVASVDGPIAGAADVTVNAYDALNRLIRVTDPANGQTRYAYNGIDQLVSVTDPRNLATTYGYDGLSNLNSQQSPDTGLTVSTYDAAGNVLARTDAKGQVTSYAYDALNRPTTVTFHDGSRQTYTYDQGANGIGRLTSVAETDPQGQPTALIAYGYDAHGRTITEARTINAVVYVTGYSYDSSGRMTGITYPSGRQVSYTFDALGRIQQIATAKDANTQAVVSAVAYRPFGPFASFTLGNGQAYTRQYDQDGRVSSYTLAASAYLLGYDVASRISFISENGGATNFNGYGYDALDRLTGFIGPSTGEAFTYDGVGNRLTKSIGGSVHTYAYGAASNRLASVTPSSGPVMSYVHDANGSVTADGKNTYVYDARGRMVQAGTVVGTVGYEVNALGQRVRKTSALGDTIYHYDVQGRLIAESSPTGEVRKEYLYLGSTPVAVWQ